ncbi:hypothetical protein OROHE_025087 [Orobanche hederae]
MDTASMSHEQDQQDQRTRSRSSHNIPLEIIEEMMLNLPVKSLARFSTVSKSWYSSIFDAGFIRKHKYLAASLGRHKIVINPDYGNTTSFCAISPISLDKPIGVVIQPRMAGNAAICSISSMCPYKPAVDATDFATQFQGKPCLYAFCDELWCVEDQDSLFLWNPSMRVFKKLPDPLFQVQNRIGINLYGYENEYATGRYNRYEFAYGLGYDSAVDDYKILKVPRMDCHCTETEFYSLRSNSWRKIETFPAKPTFTQERCEFVDGTFHWLSAISNTQTTIVSFKLSTEEYGVVAQPKLSRAINFSKEDGMEVVVVRGKLCVCVNYCRKYRFVLWVMNEYGVESSWHKKFVIRYGSSLPYFPSKASAESLFTLRPLYFYDNGDILIKVSTDTCHLEIFMYKNEAVIPIRIASCGNCNNTSDAFLYVESLISPTAPAFSSSG